MQLCGRPIFLVCVLAAATVLLAGPAHGQGRKNRNAGKAREGYAAVQALEIVDCLLPGQVRVVGGRTYLTPRRPTRTTAADCGARGGEYLAYDRADYRSALNVWLPTAQQGDPKAQTMVGEIFERGLGAEPNYESAAEWYRKAADQGYAQAEFDLGALYEQGLGVPADKLTALNWYRKASGLSKDSVIFQSAAAQEQSTLRKQLEQQIGQRDRQIDALRKQVDALQRQLGKDKDAAEQLQSLKGLLAQLQTQRTDEQQRLAAMPTYRSADASRPEPSTGRRLEKGRRIEYHRKSFGRYYALIIGVQDYEHLDNLASPLNDIEQAKKLLEQKYGFSVLTLVNPDQLTLMKTVNQLNDTLTADDNLLIYFAGHGDRLKSGARETGYWLPSNAEPPPDDTLWVPNEFVSRHLGRIKAKRVLVVSDSCYAGLLGDDPGYVMVGNGQYTDEYIQWKMPKRSRLVLASGGDQPVLDNGPGGHSIFAHAFLEALQNNAKVLTAPELFLDIRKLVRESPLAAKSGQEPELKVIKDAGNEVGDFFFIPS